MRTLVTCAPVPARGRAGAAAPRETLPFSAGEAVPPGEFASAPAGRSSAHASAAARLAESKVRPFSAAVVNVWRLLRGRNAYRKLRVRRLSLVEVVTSSENRACAPKLRRPT